MCVFSLDGLVNFQASIAAASGGQFIPAAGGVLVLAPSAGGGKVVLGAVGVSGDTPEVEVECAVIGIEGAGAGLVSAPSSKHFKNTARL